MSKFLSPNQVFSLYINQSGSVYRSYCRYIYER